MYNTIEESERNLHADSVKPATIAKKALTADYETVHKTKQQKKHPHGMKGKTK